jgi:hypothetical protein
LLGAMNSVDFQTLAPLNPLDSEEHALREEFGDQAFSHDSTDKRAHWISPVYVPLRTCASEVAWSHVEVEQEVGAYLTETGARWLLSTNVTQST